MSIEGAAWRRAWALYHYRQTGHTIWALVLVPFGTLFSTVMAFTEDAHSVAVILLIAGILACGAPLLVRRSATIALVLIGGVGVLSIGAFVVLPAAPTGDLIEALLAVAALAGYSAFRLLQLISSQEPFQMAPSLVSEAGVGRVLLVASSRQGGRAVLDIDEESHDIQWGVSVFDVVPGRHTLSARQEGHLIPTGRARLSVLIESRSLITIEYRGAKTTGLLGSMTVVGKPVDLR